MRDVNGHFGSGGECTVRLRKKKQLNVSLFDQRAVYILIDQITQFEVSRYTIQQDSTVAV